jgi:hypothetical protein|tara:strand:+ start:2423 stop:3154 length:732 start_codon:yes stop_codon:yes gene_type:complete
MPRATKTEQKTKTKEKETTEEVTKLTPNDIGWTDYVLDLLSDDEKIKGNPTTDGLRRIFEIALDCIMVDSTSQVAQSPDPNNGNRATVVHSLSYVLNDSTLTLETKSRTVNGAADVYWGNCDKIFRNHPVAVAETRAEGRALRRGLKLRKVVAAEELAGEIEDHPDAYSSQKISANQINFIDILSERLNINTKGLLKKSGLDSDDIHSISHEKAVGVIRSLSEYQQKIDTIPEEVLGYDKEWK